MHKYICIYIYVYVYMCICVYLYVYVYIYIYIYIYIFVCVYKIPLIIKFYLVYLLLIALLLDGSLCKLCPINCQLI